MTLLSNITPNFIEGPSSEVSMEELTFKNIIPTFCDNTLTISHQKFIETTRKAAEVIFGQGNITPAETRCSHPIIGRIPSAQHKKASELRDDEKTLFYQRLAWIAHITTLTSSINGQQVSLTIGGTRSYSEDKLYARQNPQHFRVFIGFRVRVCSNMMLTTDGISDTMLCMTEMDVFQKAFELFKRFNEVKESTLYNLEALNNRAYAGAVLQDHRETEIISGSPQHTAEAATANPSRRLGSERSDKRVHQEPQLRYGRQRWLYLMLAAHAAAQRGSEEQL